jgi:hypothetical protein
MDSVKLAFFAGVVWGASKAKNESQRVIDSARKEIGFDTTPPQQSGPDSRDGCVCVGDDGKPLNQCDECPR